MKENIIFKKFIRICELAYGKGWHERNGGNLSYRLDTDEIESIKSILENGGSEKTLPSPVVLPGGEYFLCTASGSYFMDIFENPKASLCIIQINEAGTGYTQLYGENLPTSELLCHLLCHSSSGSETRAVYHSHPVAIAAMTFILPLTDKAFSYALWQTISEAAMVFPEGVGVLPWMPPGSKVLAGETSQKIREYNAVVWANHGLITTGKDLRDVYSLTETIEKAAKIWLMYSGRTAVNTLSDKQLEELAQLGGGALRKKWD